MVGFMEKARKSKKGFTLTELIVVIAILGILATVATPMVLDYVTDAKISADEANARAIEDIIKRGIVKGDLTPPFEATDAAAITARVEKEIKPLPTTQQFDIGIFEVSEDGLHVKAVSGEDAEAGYIKIG